MTFLIACSVGLATSSPALADPTEFDSDSGASPSVLAGALVVQEPTPEAVTACSQFSGALNFAAINYGDFANALAISDGLLGADPILSNSNVMGRTALRKAASAALAASRTPGLQPEVAAAIRGWSVGATKLVLLMGMRADVDRLNNAATQLNDHAHDAQMACAHAGTRA